MKPLSEQLSDLADRAIRHISQPLDEPQPKGQA
jgi:hypothetical protein